MHGLRLLRTSFSESSQGDNEHVSASQTLYKSVKEDALRRYMHARSSEEQGIEDTRTQTGENPALISFSSITIPSQELETHAGHEEVKIP